MEKKKTAPRKRTELTPDGSTLRRSERVQGQERVDYHEYLESEIRSESDDDEREEQLFYGLKMRAADPRYITHGDDGNRGDILLTLAQVRELITVKEHSEEGVATVWLTTAEMGFSLTRRAKHGSLSQGCEGRESQRPIPSSSNITICDKYSGKSWNWGGNVSASQGRLWRELVSLRQRWGKVSNITEGDNIRVQACSDANASRLFTRIVQRKNLPWEKDSYCESGV